MENTKNNAFEFTKDDIREIKSCENGEVRVYLKANAVQPFMAKWVSADEVGAMMGSDNPSQDEKESCFIRLYVDADKKIVSCNDFVCPQGGFEFSLSESEGRLLADLIG